MDEPMRLKKIPSEIEMLLQKTEHIVNSNTDYSALKAIADYLTQIRVQLTELMEATGSRTTDKDYRALKESTARCISLEGRIKEIRNESERRAKTGGKELH